MQYRSLGRSQLKVSTLCLGTMMFGDQTGREEAAAIVADAHAQGVNFIDTADVYSKGASESMVGELIKGQRQDWVLASKLGNSMSDRVNEGRYSQSWMLREVGKRDQLVLESFLNQFAARLPRTALRYAIERFDEPTRHRYLVAGK